MPKQIITKKRTTPLKKRSQSCYQNKVKRMEDWYNHLQEERKVEKINPNTKSEVKRKELKSLKEYIDLIKQPKGE